MSRDLGSPLAPSYGGGGNRRKRINKKNQKSKGRGKHKKCGAVGGGPKNCGKVGNAIISSLGAIGAAGATIGALIGSKKNN